MSTIDQLMKGAIDFHVHADPDPFHERRLDVLNLALQAKEMGMRAIVFKCHHYGTAPLASIVNQITPDFLLIGSLVLNGGVGGLNPEVVEVAAKVGAKVIWMPTYSSVPDTKRRTEDPNYPLRPTKAVSEGGISLIGQDGKLVPEMAPILEIIKDNNIVLGTGHISTPEIYAITNEARRMQSKVIITHAMSHLGAGPLTLEQQKELVSMGAYIENCFLSCLPPVPSVNPAAMVENIKALGVEHCILSTDLGQNRNPAPPEGFRVMLANMLTSGLSEKELEILVKTNPAKLLDLD